MNKPCDFQAYIYLESDIKDNELYNINNLIHQYGFLIDYNAGQEFLFAKDIVYENLQSRMIYLLRILRKENFFIKSYKITCTIFNSKLHGELI